MNKFQGLENLAPSIVKFPFVTAIKAVVNIKLGKKIPGSLAKIAALIIGLLLGYLFPEIGSFMSFFLSLFMTNPLNAKLTTGITYACSMVLSASVLMFATKKIFEYYYLNKYGVSNPELRLTGKDRKNLTLFFEDEKMSKPDIIEKLNQIELRIKYLVNKIRLYKLTGNEEYKQTAKFALNSLKRGDFLIFEEYFESAFKSRGTKRSDLDRLNSNYNDSYSANNTDNDYYGDYGDYNDYEDSADENSSNASSEDKADKYYTRSYGQYNLRPNFQRQHRDSTDKSTKHDSREVHGVPASSRISLNLYGIKRDDIRLSRDSDSDTHHSPKRLEIVFS